MVIDCKKRTVLPGFNDAHFHLHAFAESLVTLNLSSGKGIRSISDIQAEIKKFSQKIPQGTWIRAAGYNEFHLPEKRHPNRWELDGAAPHHPLKLTHRSGHAHVLNSFALKLTGISQSHTGSPRRAYRARYRIRRTNRSTLWNGGFLIEKNPSPRSPTNR